MQKSIEVSEATRKAEESQAAAKKTTEELEKHLEDLSATVNKYFIFWF